MSTKTVSSRIPEESYDKLIEIANKQGKSISILLKELVESTVNTDKQTKLEDEMIEVEFIDNDKEKDEPRLVPEKLEVVKPKKEVVKLVDEDILELKKEDYNCENCGAKLERDYIYCGNCGEELDWSGFK